MNTLTFEEYESMGLETAIYTEKVIYPALGLAGEAGEVADKIKKLIRDKGYKSGKDIHPDDAHDILLELGDVLWYINALAHDLGASMEDVARLNYEKLTRRKRKGLIGGSGDHRGE